MSYDYGGYGLGRKADAILGKGKQPSNNSNTSNNTSFLRSPARKEDNSIDSSDDGVGHSENDGIPQHENSTIVEPSEEQCYADIEACYNYLVYNKSVPPSCVILYGKSLGSGPTCWLAQKLCKRFESGRKKSLMNQERRVNYSRNRPKVTYYTSNANKSFSLDGNFHDNSTIRATSEAQGNVDNVHGPGLPIGGVILHSAFLSVLRIMVNVGFTPIGDCFPNVDRVSDITSCPIYLIHGKEDEVIPFSHGKELYEAILMTRGGKAFPPFWADDAAHSNIESKYATAYVKRLQQFVKHVDSRVVKVCGENLGERSQYVKERSMSVDRRISCGEEGDDGKEGGLGAAVTGDDGMERYRREMYSQRLRTSARGRQASRDQSSSNCGRSKSRGLEEREGTGSSSLQRSKSRGRSDEKKKSSEGGRKLFGMRPRTASRLCSESRARTPSKEVAAAAITAPESNDTARGRGTTTLDNRARATHSRRNDLLLSDDTMRQARSNSHKRQLKKKGSLVIRGLVHDETQVRTRSNGMGVEGNLITINSDGGLVYANATSAKSPAKSCARGGNVGVLTQNQAMTMESESRNPTPEH